MQAHKRKKANSAVLVTSCASVLNSVRLHRDQRPFYFSTDICFVLCTHFVEDALSFAHQEGTFFTQQCEKKVIPQKLNLFCKKNKLPIIL